MDGGHLSCRRGWRRSSRPAGSRITIPETPVGSAHPYTAFQWDSCRYCPSQSSLPLSSEKEPGKEEIAVPGVSFCARRRHVRLQT